MSTPDYITIPLTQGQVTIVDAKFAELVQYKWQAWWNKFTQSYYAKCSGRNSFAYKKYNQNYLSRVIMSLHLGRPLLRTELVDHVNHDTLDNRLENLAVKTGRGNQLNGRRRRNNSSQYKGVHWDKRSKKWMSRISDDNGNRKYLGLFIDLEYAAREYDRAYLYFGGDDAMPNCLNFPDEIEIRRQELRENVYRWMR